MTTPSPARTRPPAPRRWLARLARSAVATAVLTAMACSGVPQEGEGIPTTTPPVDERPVLRFGVISSHNPVVMYRIYQPMMDFLGERK